jgi:glycosyltransferase involved in cell wall biosynthesis
MKLAIIPATFNRPAALAALLEGYLAQNYPDFEIIVADDGSGPATREVIEQFRQRARFRIDHVWQENQGYRAATIRNKALAVTTADYIIYTDQDCVPPPDFLSQHARLAERGWFVPGNRVLLSAALTQRVESEKLPIHTWSFGQWLRCRWSGDINRMQPLIALPDGPWRKLHPLRWEGAKTCNLAVWREDLVRVNGMDESYAGWGLEDSDLVVRLLRAGLQHKSGRYAAPLFHLWHREQDKSKLAENQQRMNQMLQSQQVVAALGLSQHIV